MQIINSNTVLMIKVLFFAQLREQLHTDAIDLPFIADESIAALKQRIVLLHPEWQAVLQATQLLASINHDYAKSHSLVPAGAEVGFFPPVTGG